jgi:hypothetical protein
VSKITGDFHIYLNQYDTQSPWCIALIQEGNNTEYRFNHIEIQCPLASVDMYHVMPHKNRYKLLAVNATLVNDNGVGILRSVENV